MNLTETHVLLINGYLEAESVAQPRPLTDVLKNRNLLTVISNFNYYGFMPSQEVLHSLHAMTDDELTAFWARVEPVIKDITASDRKMDEHVVYQNFPREVLEMEQSVYWAKQILMYFGFDKDHFREEKVERAPLFENTQLRVLHLADHRTLHSIYHALLDSKNRWTPEQFEQVQFLIQHFAIRDFTMAKVGFRENGVQTISYLMDNVDDPAIIVPDATDVLRLAALRSESEVSLRGAVKFKSFSRRERRNLCRMLETSKHLEGDMAERPTLWKRLLSRLHPGDFRYERVSAAYNSLYNGNLRSYASQVEAGIKNEDVKVLKTLQGRPGEFVRRFHHLHNVFGEAAVAAFSEVMPKLTTYQLLKMMRYAKTINNRKTLAYPPRGNWNKLKVAENNKKPLPLSSIEQLETAASGIISERLGNILPERFDVDPQTDNIKLQTNDQELAAYGRGTVFQIPAEMNFIRSGSYWQVGHRQTIWFDNGWNFFDANWSPNGVICWNRTSMDGAAFSGDPLSGADKKGRACQVIDLYIDKLLKQGVRYAVWSVLCFSHVPFSAVDEVIASLQWGENAQTGGIYEPSRAQFVTPIGGDNLTKFILYVDLVERKVVFMDANLGGNVSSAGANNATLSQQMPAFVEYLNTLPSVYDLFKHADGGKTPVVYTDRDREITNNQMAYVFRTENENSKFQQLDLTKFL